MSEQTPFKTENAYTQTFKIFTCMIAIVLAGFYLLSSVLIPIIISFTLYAIFEPATLYLVRHHVNHSLAIVIVLVFLVVPSLLVNQLGPRSGDQKKLRTSPQIAGLAGRRKTSASWRWRGLPSRPQSQTTLEAYIIGLTLESL